MEVNVEVDPVLIQLDPINAGGPPGGSAKLLRERANPPPVVLKMQILYYKLYESIWHLPTLTALKPNKRTWFNKDDFKCLKK